MSWFRISNDRGTGDTIVSLRADANPGANERASTLRVKTPQNTYVDVHITQEGISEFSTFIYEVTGDTSHFSFYSQFTNADAIRMDGGEWFSLSNSVSFDAKTGIHVFEVRHSYNNYFIFKNLQNAPNKAVLKKVSISSKVTGGLSSSSLKGNTELETIELSPNYVNDVIPEDFCSGCTALTSFNLPSGITKINAHAFSGCTSLSSFNIPDDSVLNEIRDMAFYDCASLVSFTFPAGLQSVGVSGFWGCLSLTGVSWANINSCRSLGISVFSKCSSLVDFTFPPNVSSMANLFFAQYDAPIMALSGVTFDLDCALTSIGDMIFNGQGWRTELPGFPNLTTFTIPRNVTKLDGTFFNAHPIDTRDDSSIPNLTTIYAYPSTAPTLTGGAFYAIRFNPGTLHYPAGSDYSSWLTELGSTWTGVADL